MADAAVGQIYRVILRGTLVGQQIQNVFDYRLQTLPAPDTVANLYGDIIDVIGAGAHIIPSFLDCVPDNYQLVDALIQVITPQRIRAGVAIINLPGVRGTSDTANIQGSVQRFGELAARKAVGGVRIPISTAATDIAIGFVSATQFTALTNLGTAMTLGITGPLTGAVLAPVIFNRSFLPNYTLVIGAVAKNTVRTMHRRTVGLGK